MKTYKPGPWEASGFCKADNCYHVGTIGSKGYTEIELSNNKFMKVVIADVFGDECNAQLISAAPDLLEACQDIFKALIERIGGLPDSTFRDPYFKIKNAIAKATDTQQKLR